MTTTLLGRAWDSLVMSVSQAGGGATQVAPPVAGPAITSPWYVASDGANVYWTDNIRFSAGSGSVWTTTVAGGAPDSTIATGQDAPYRIVTDGTYVFWGDGNGDVIEYSPSVAVRRSRSH